MPADIATLTTLAKAGLTIKQLLSDTKADILGCVAEAQKDAARAALARVATSNNPDAQMREVITHLRSSAAIYEKAANNKGIIAQFGQMKALQKLVPCKVIMAIAYQAIGEQRNAVEELGEALNWFRCVIDSEYQGVSRGPVRGYEEMQMLKLCEVMGAKFDSGFIFKRPYGVSAAGIQHCKMFAREEYVRLDFGKMLDLAVYHQMDHRETLLLAQSCDPIPWDKRTALSSFMGPD